MFFAVLLIFILFRMELLDLPGETIYAYEVTIALAANKMKGNWLIIKFYTIFIFKNSVFISVISYKQYVFFETRLCL